MFGKAIDNVSGQLRNRFTELNFEVVSRKQERTKISLGETQFRLAQFGLSRLILFIYNIHDTATHIKSRLREDRVSVALESA